MGNDVDEQCPALCLRGGGDKVSLGGAHRVHMLISRRQRKRRIWAIYNVDFPIIINPMPVAKCAGAVSGVSWGIATALSDQGGGGVGGKHPLGK